ncbi:hypothetical protein Cob_v001262 [Colletotrichum orbiculare MAFF 240422]|uniref:Uncharacterized protein n=1 Tax=Colletotrichum orbiculare (strain 104-T / ATCC 96160 / CBS 514.97 / LARS 414 / MAFF 240422) TaxID=1213857 RepID=N4VNF6_COLOR|nr:hypothetical protein Cob_v001262 [Colletotrichum orbiculare MAFF 240422]
MAKSSAKHSSSKHSSSSKSKSSSKHSSSKTPTASTVPVNRSWQDPSLERGGGQPSASSNYPVGRWLTEPVWQEPFNTIAEVPAVGSAAGYGAGQQGSGASATYATSRPPQHR